MFKPFSFSFILISCFLPQAVLADNQAKFNLVKKIFQEEEFYTYASPEFKRVMDNGYKVAKKIEPELGCDLVEHYHLGLGNGGLPVRNLKLSTLSSGLIRAKSDIGEEPHHVGQNIVDFDITCKGNKCQVNDVFSDTSSYKQKNEYIAKYKTCGY